MSAPPTDAAADGKSNDANENSFFARTLRTVTIWIVVFIVIVIVQATFFGRDIVDQLQWMLRTTQLPEGFLNMLYDNQWIVMFSNSLFFTFVLLVGVPSILVDVVQRLKEDNKQTEAKAPPSAPSDSATKPTSETSTNTEKTKPPIPDTRSANQPTGSTPTSLSEDLLTRAKVVETRAKWFFRYLVVGSLVVAVGVIFSGSLAKLDLRAFSPISRIDSEIAKAEAEIISISTLIEHRRLNIRPTLALLAALSDGVKDFASTASLSELERLLKRKQDQILNMYDIRRIALRSYYTEPSDVQKTIGGDNEQTTDYKFLVLSLLTRVTLLTVGVLLIYILLSFYKHDVLLTRFYYAQADALRLASGDSKAFTTILRELAPRNIAFGKEPTSPVKEAAGTVRSLMSPKSSPKSRSKTSASTTTA